ncbi:MAG: transcription antitermination factor NusB [Alphaproteobacteria bacterium]
MTTKGGARRSAARLAAVQALYQIELTGATAAAVIGEFVAHRLDSRSDHDFFTVVVDGATAQGVELDRMIDDALADDMSVPRLEAILRAILRAGAFELWRREDVPLAVVINEYIDVAHAFFDGPQPGIVNAVLERLGRTLRPSDDGAG